MQMFGGTMARAVFGLAVVMLLCLTWTTTATAVPVAVTEGPVPVAATELPLEASPATADAPPVAYGFHALSPSRILDTRIGLGSGGAVGAGASIELKVTGVGGVPLENVGAVVVNVTGVEPSTGTFVTVFPTGSPVPVASNLNLAPREIKPNLVVAKVGVGGKISLYNSNGTTHLIADVTGWLPLGESYNPLAPKRLLDTRTGTGAAKARVGAGKSIDLTVTGVGGVPATGVGAVVLNVTGVEPSAGSFVTVHPTGEPVPVASNLNLAPGEIKPNLVIAKVGVGGKVSLYNSNGTTDLIADVMGWLPSGGSYVPLSPTRLLDTRIGTGAPNAPVGQGASLSLQVTGVGGVPLEGVGAVVLNVTGVEPTTGTFVTVHPTGEAVPVASNLNLAPREIKPNLVVVKVGAGGKVNLFNNSGTVNLLADVTGWLPVATLVDADTIALTGPELNPVVAVTPTSIKVSTAAGPWAQAHVGSVLAGGVSPASPTGFLVRVTAMTPGAGGAVTYTTVPAAIDEAIADGELHADFGTGNAPPAPDPSIGVGFGIGKEFTATETVANSTGSATVTATGQVSVGASVDLDIDVDLFPPGVEAELSATANESASGSISLSGEAGWSKTWDLGEWAFGTYTFAIGPVPVVIQPQVELGAHASAQVSGKVEVGFTQSGSVTAGIKYDDGLKTFHNETFQGPALTGPTVEAQASATVGVDASVEVELYGAAEAGITLTPHLDLEADLCEANVSWGLDASASFELEVSHVIDKEKNIPLGTLAGGELAAFNMPTETGQCRPWSGSMTSTLLPRTDGLSGTLTYTIPEGALPMALWLHPNYQEFDPVGVEVDVVLSRAYELGDCHYSFQGARKGPVAGFPDLRFLLDGTHTPQQGWELETTGFNGTYFEIPYTLTTTKIGPNCTDDVSQGTERLGLWNQVVATETDPDAVDLSGTVVNGFATNQYSFQREA
jgi:hypothetical protein